MAHNGLQERAAALNTPVNESTGEIQITAAAAAAAAAGATGNLGFQGQPVGVQIGFASNVGPQTQSAQIVDGRNADQVGDSQGGSNVSNVSPLRQSAPVEGGNAYQTLSQLARKRKAPVTRSSTKC